MSRKYFRNTYFLLFMIFHIPFYIFYCTENRHYDNNMAAMQISKMYTISPYEVKVEKQKVAGEGKYFIQAVSSYLKFVCFVRDLY